MSIAKSNSDRPERNPRNTKESRGKSTNYSPKPKPKPKAKSERKSLTTSKETPHREEEE
jgi:hypothetical protein